MSVLVTGGAGFLGRPLVRALAERGGRVVSLDRQAPADPSPAGVVDLVGDITDGAGVERVLREHAITDIVHGAAIVGVTASVAGLTDSVRVNVDGSVALFEAVKRVGGVRRVVDLSSEEVYGHFTADPITEDAHGVPISPYGITKYAVERLGGYYAEQYGLPYVAARLCWVYGPGFPRQRLPQPWLEDAVAGRTSRLDTGGDHRIDLTYLEDVIDGILTVLRADQLAHRAYNVATGLATEMRELADEIARQYPGWTVDLAGGPIHMAPGVAAAWKGALDISRVRELGYTPRFSLAGGLARTAATLTAPPEPATEGASR